MSSILLIFLLTAAQQQLPASSLRPASNLQYGTYDFANGFTVTAGANRTIGPDVLFDTTANFSYFYGVIGSDTTKQEWLDEAWLPNRGLSGEEQITGMGWNYCEGGYTAYFDAFVSLYTDTVACLGPSAWVPATPSFADCLYAVNGIPGSGCWNVTIDLSGGMECVLPDSSNPVAGAQGTIGWSVTPFNCNNTPYLGPLLGRQADAMPGSQDTFEWRDWSGLYFGSYVYGGCYWTGSGSTRLDFLVAFYGAAVDVQNCYGSNALDTLLLEAADEVENGATWNYNVTGVAGGAQRALLLVQPDVHGTDPGCDQAAMSGIGGSFTRQVAMQATTAFFLGAVSADFSGSVAVPAGPPDLHVFFQVVTFPAAGPILTSQVIAASNGIDTTL